METTPAFTLHPTLSADTLLVADLPLCQLRLMNDRQYPWFMLVPRGMQGEGSSAYLRDLSDVPPASHAQLWREVMALEKAVRAATGAFKMNVAQLGNVAQQLHIHVIARFETDAAWPAPIWGKHPPVPYQPSEAGQLIARVKAQLSAVFPDSL